MHLSRSFASAASPNATPAAAIAASSALRVSVGGVGACEHPATIATAKLATTNRIGLLVRMMPSPPGMLHSPMLRLRRRSRRHRHIRAPHIDDALPASIRLLPPDLGVLPVIARGLAPFIVPRKLIRAVGVRQSARSRGVRLRRRPANRNSG